jgi:Fe-S-cluster containining protein
MDRHFHCTACGKCCFGRLPLTLDDARRHAGRFPLALAWMPVARTSRNHELAKRLGVALKLRNRAQIAVVITPIAYLPPEFPCPELTPGGLCGIHETKPLRCRGMPFYPYREERDQADLLVPRKGWACDISPGAPLVYHDRRIVDRADFDRERAALLEQAPTMRRYAEYALKYMPWLLDSLDAAMRQPNGQVVTSLSSFFTAIKPDDAAVLAKLQRPVLQGYAARTSGMDALVEYRRHYAAWAEEMTYLAGAGGQDAQVD